MKYLKDFNNLNSEPEEGDWVYCEVDPSEYTPNKFIGKLLTTKNKRRQYPYRVDVHETHNISEDEDAIRLVAKGEIKAFSKNIKDLEIYMVANKYNI